MKKIISLFVAIGLATSLFGCGSSPTTPAKEETSKMSVGYQVDPPKDGEEIAKITTNMGVIKMRFFPEEAPKTVENFKGLAKKGYYNGVTFHRIIPDFMIQGGDPEGTGRGGESFWGKPFADEFSDKLFNITGSVSMANAGKNTNGSQFFINNSTVAVDWARFQEIYDSYYFPHKEEFNAQYGGTVDMEKVTDEIKKLYDTYCGNISLDGGLSTNAKGHTVFAQVFEGQDVVDKISKVQTDQQDKPAENVVMEKVEIITYKA
ncbi:MAG: peptidylprolyl isomerase [Oscillospiraceae bacterium]